MPKPVAVPSYRDILAKADTDPKAKIFVVDNCVKIDRGWSLSRVAGWLSRDLRQQREHLKKCTIESYLAAARAEFPALRDHPDPTLTARKRIAAHDGHALRGSFIKELDLIIRSQGARAIHEVAHQRIALQEFPRIFSSICATFTPLAGDQLTSGTALMEDNGWMRRLGAANTLLTGLARNAYWLRLEQDWQTIGRSAGLRLLAESLARPIVAPGMVMPLHKWSDAGNVRHFLELVRQQQATTGAPGSAHPARIAGQAAEQINRAMADCVALSRQMFGMRSVATST